MTTTSLDAALTGMLEQQHNIELISNNIANVNTTGYKRVKVHFQDLLDTAQILAYVEGTLPEGSEPATASGVTTADAAGLAALLAARRNDLTEAATARAPAVGEALAVLGAEAGSLLARMSGSGATCFALFAGAGEAQAAAQRMATAHPGWWVAAAPLLADAARAEF